MTVEQTEVDPYDARLARGAAGLLAEFNAAGVLSAADVHVAQRLGRLAGEADESVRLAAALTVRAVRLGSVCITLAGVRETAAADDEESAVDVAALPWPEVGPWQDAVTASQLVAVGADGDPSRPLRLIDDLLYLDRYWRQEEVVRYEIDERLARPEPEVDAVLLETTLDGLFTGDRDGKQRLAARTVAERTVTVLAGGPGTGKTTTVARLLHLLRTLGGSPRIALAAPTGKAAARLEEAVALAAAADDLDVGPIAASTLHRLLGRRPGHSRRFRHDRDNRLPYDVVVVDECSMVSLTMMSRLLEAVRPDARLVLVGDPDQLASVEAGAVLGDLVARPSDGLDRSVVRLTERFRYGEAIGELADAVRGPEPDPQRVVDLLRAGGDHIGFVETDAAGAPHAPGLDLLRREVVAAGRGLVAAARAGDVAEALTQLERHRLLCAHRRGPYGVGRWSGEVERWLTQDVPGYGHEGEWYVGRPLLVTANDYDVELYNGDTGVIVDGAELGPQAAFARGAAPKVLSPHRLTAVQTVHAMTVHRGQGSQFDRVTFLLPPPESPLLTRELLYTAITRAQSYVRVIGSEESVRRAVGRPVLRASGLRRR